MNLTIGKYSLAISRGETRNAMRAPGQELGASRASPAEVPVLVSMDQPRSSFITNPWDHPRQNIQLIRETVSACMHARSEALSKGRFHAYAIDNGTRIVDTRKSSYPLSTIHSPLPSNHPLERLLQNPNPLFDFSDMLELSSQWLDATGNALWLKVRNGHGIVTELWPVAALSFIIERGNDQLPAAYRFLPANVTIPAGDIIHIRRADIRSAPFLGHAVLSDILDTAKAETAVRLFQSRFFDNDATPRAVLRWPAGAMMTQEQMDQVRAGWEAKYATPLNAGRIAILPDGGEVQLLAPGSKELDFSKSKKELRDSIREAFKVPQIVLGDVEGVNLANGETSYMIFMRDVVDYSLAKHARAFTRALAPDFPTGNINSGTSTSIIIEHESLVPETEEHFMTRVSELKQAMTVDEQRALVNLPPLPNGKGKVFLLGSEVVGEDWKTIS
ncbi:MAG: phage portal protein [Bacteroidota bacterium]|nr:phage portal protein [Bacteroidota bacterium]MDP4231870.1 phage portal protein [Bacteroidota bacterium]MDP4242756.1 phage portal protein [Bacteroidota bacterium]MDP4287207.1 phage portal protein [Bacteroidota bacterium]